MKARGVNCGLFLIVEFRLAIAEFFRVIQIEQLLVSNSFEFNFLMKSERFKDYSTCGVQR